MNEVNCPYCDHLCELDPEDAFMNQDNSYPHECGKCDKRFLVTSTILVTHEAKAVDCLNGAEHQWRYTHAHPRVFTKMMCQGCGEIRTPTEDEFLDKFSNAFELKACDRCYSVTNHLDGICLKCAKRDYYVRCFDKFNIEIFDEDIVDVQMLGKRRVYIEEGQLWFNPRGFKERVSSYFSNDLIKMK